MRKTVTLLALFCMLGVAMASASNHTGDTADASPGMITPDSALYGMETAWDNAAMGIGLKRAGDVAQERAAEAREMVNRNNSEGMDRASEELSKVADSANDSDEEGLDRAMTIMEETLANAPNENAAEGMQTALENMRNAQQKVQEARDRAVQARENAGGDEEPRRPDIGNPQDTPAGNDEEEPEQRPTPPNDTQDEDEPEQPSQ